MGEDRPDLAERRKAWRSLPWELIPETLCTPVLNLAVDEALILAAVAGRRGPTLRFWGWAAPAVVLGRFQSVRNEVDADAAAAAGTAVVRRMTGGGAMLLQPAGAITYSIVAPEALAAGLSIRDSYALLDGWVVELVRELGVAAFHRPINDIACEQGKIAGAAQARRSGWILHHTTIAYEMDSAEMMRILRIGRERLSDKGVLSAGKPVSPLRQHVALSRAGVVERLIAGFRERFGLADGGLRPEESADAERLVVEKYATEAWINDVP